MVVWSRRDEGFTDTHMTVVNFDGVAGNLTATHDAVTRRRGGRIFLPGEERAWTFTAADGEPVWLVEHLRGDLICDLPAPPAAARQDPLPGDNSPPAPATPAPEPDLNSRPDATGVLYIDFDGQPPAVYTDWLLQVGLGAYAVPHSGLTTAQMEKVWRRVAEDYIPFHVNVTTEAARYANAPVGKRMRILVGATLPSGMPGGGAAWMNSFRAVFPWSSTVPGWVAVDRTYDTPPTDANLATLAAAISHEFGHSLGLWHDGNDGAQPSDFSHGNYYPGHGTEPWDWSPIMGRYFRDASATNPRGTSRTMVQWATNSYPGANNAQDDFAVIASAANGLGYAADESSGAANAVLLEPVLPGLVGGTGMIYNGTDTDWWRFTVDYAGLGAVEMAPAENGVSLPNLDCGFFIADGTGANISGAVQFQDDLEASTTWSFTPGTYYVVAYSTGNRSFTTGGYDAYGSTGRYVVTVAPPVDNGLPQVAVTSPVNNSVITGAPQFHGTAGDLSGINRLERQLLADRPDPAAIYLYWQRADVGLHRSAASARQQRRSHAGELYVSCHRLRPAGKSELRGVRRQRGCERPGRGHHVTAQRQFARRAGLHIHRHGDGEWRAAIRGRLHPAECGRALLEWQRVAVRYVGCASELQCGAASADDDLRLDLHGHDAVAGQHAHAGFV
jgi:hypothetical protein